MEPVLPDLGAPCKRSPLAVHWIFQNMFEEQTHSSEWQVDGSSLIRHATPESPENSMKFGNFGSLLALVFLLFCILYLIAVTSSSRRRWKFRHVSKAHTSTTPRFSVRMALSPALFSHQTAPCVTTHGVRDDSPRVYLPSSWHLGQLCVASLLL